MEQKISTTDELHMTRAIEKAATLADVNEELDRNKLIVEQLQKEHVDSRFAKTAAAAFNKRLTVLKLQKTADEHKAEPFPLCDPELVYQMMGGEPEITKTASLNTQAFSIEYTPRSLRKAASAYVKPLYESTITAETLMTRVGCLLDKTAAAVNEMVSAVDNATAKRDALRSEVMAALENDKTASYTLKRAYGQEYADLLRTSEKLEKKACVLPSGGVYDKFESLKKATEDLAIAEGKLEAFSKMASELCNSANELQLFAAGMDMTKTAADAFGLSDGREYERYLNRRQNRAAGALALDAAIGLPLAAAETGLYGTMNLAKNMMDPIRSGFGNAYNMYMAGKPQAESASKVLDSEFLLNDRYRDRLMAVSDLSADPALSKFYFGDLLASAQKAMDLDSRLERPDSREVLRPLVSQILLQNGIVSMADVAAESSIASDRAKAAEHNTIIENADRAAEKSRKERPEKLSLGNVFTMPELKAPGLSDMVAKTWDKDLQDLHSAHQDYVKERTTNQKARDNEVRGIAMQMLQKEFPDHTFEVAGNNIVAIDSSTGARTVLDETALKGLLPEAQDMYETLGAYAKESLKADIDKQKADRKTEKEQLQTSRTLAIQQMLAEHPDTGDAELRASGELLLHGKGGNSDVIIPAKDMNSLIGKIRDDISALGISDAVKLYGSYVAAENERTKDRKEQDRKKQEEDQKAYDAGVSELKRRGAAWDAGDPRFPGDDPMMVWPLRDAAGNILRDANGRIQYDPSMTGYVTYTDDEMRELGRNAMKGQGQRKGKK